MRILTTTVLLLVATITIAAEATVKVSADKIIAGLSSGKTPAERTAWWQQNMAFKERAVSGKVISGPGLIPEILLDIGQGVKVSCYIKASQIKNAKKLAPGRQLNCHGVVGSSWTSAFGLSFYVDTTGATAAAP